MATVRRVTDADEMAQVAAAEFTRCLQEAGQRQGYFSVALSGGRTPRGLYDRLAAGGPGAPSADAWRRTFVFTVDERRVPPSHPDNNFNLIYHRLLRPLRVPARNAARFFSEGPDTALGAWVMEDRLKRHFKLTDGEMPRFDLIVLGLGEDGHTASLFPGCDAVKETRRMAVDTWVPQLNDHRFTMTPPVLNAARRIVFLVSGASKAAIVQEALAGSAPPESLPVRIVEPAAGSVLWIVDEAAAAGLKGIA